ncbi:TetR family transcriptional regulator (fragment) [metagenome]|uniref:TetR family transcriptional regulator n=1 Tax=metagenome TaxID=256318 RepID=A0A2P2BXJ2_9ZZZZ
MPEPAALSAKAEQTRQAIVDAAMRLFRSSGYDRTTMRAIAGEADVSLGNAYYYFSSKEHLIQAFYDQVQHEHAEAVAPVLAGNHGFVARLDGVLQAWVTVAAPYHEFAGKFFRNAAEPSSPLSPFSEESKPTREAALGILRQVLDGSDLKVAPSLRNELPELLWLMQMGLVLFWVHDTSPDQRRTRTLITQAVPLVDKLVRMTRLPVIRGLVDDLVQLLKTLRA